MTDGEISSVPDPVGERVSREKKMVGYVKKMGSHIVKPGEDESPIESEGELTPFKKVMDKKEKMFAKDVEQTPMPKRKWWALVTSEDPIAESNDKSFLWKPVQVSNIPAIIDSLTAGSDTKCIKCIPIKSRLEPEPASGHPVSSTTCEPMMKTSKPTLKLNHSNNPDMDVKQQEFLWPSMLKLKSSGTKIEVEKAKEALRDAKEVFKSGQKIQKRVREEARRVKGSVKEPGVHDWIKTSNKEVDAKSDQSYSPHFSQLSKGKNVHTHQDRDQATSKLDYKKRQLYG